MVTLWIKQLLFCLIWESNTFFVCVFCSKMTSESFRRSRRKERQSWIRSLQVSTDTLSPVDLHLHWKLWPNYFTGIVQTVNYYLMRFIIALCVEMCDLCLLAEKLQSVATLFFLPAASFLSFKPLFIQTSWLFTAKASSSCRVFPVFGLCECVCVKCVRVYRG